MYVCLRILLHVLPYRSTWMRREKASQNVYCERRRTWSCERSEKENPVNTPRTNPMHMSNLTTLTQNLNAFESPPTSFSKIWDFKGTFEFNGQKGYFDGGGAAEVDSEFYFNDSKDED